MFEERFEMSIIGIVVKDFLTTVSTVYDVVDFVPDVGAFKSWHNDILHHTF